MVTIVANFGVLGAGQMPYTSWSTYILMALSVVPFSIYGFFRPLRKGRFQPVFGSWVMTEGEDQRLTFMKLYARCPCGGKIHLRDAPKGSNEPCIGRCDKDPRQHTFTLAPKLEYRVGKTRYLTDLDSEALCRSLATARRNNPGHRDWKPKLH